MPKQTPSSRPAKRSRSSSPAPSGARARKPTRAQQLEQIQVAIDEAVLDAKLGLIVRLLEEGVSLAPISRASGIAVEDLEGAVAGIPGLSRSVRVASADELGQLAAKLAYRALEEGMRMLDEGNDSIRLRLITALSQQPMRRMQTDTSDQLNAMRKLLDTILLGGEVADEEGADEDVPVS